MRNTYVVKFLLPVIITLGAYSFAANKVFTGIVTDDMCSRKHTMMPGKPDSDCVHACVKAGSKYAVLIGDSIYKLEGRTEQADKLAGRSVKLTGNIQGDRFRVAAIEPAK